MDKGRVLIVEDETLIAMELKDRLERNHYTVCGVVARGEDAIRQIEQFEPDVALLDVHLAGKLNGIETAKQLRNKLNIPIIYLTAYSDPWLVEQAAKTEPYGYLVKPFEERELRATIDLALYKHMMEQRVRDNERRLSALFDQSAVGIAEINVRTGWFLRVNRRYREIAGYGPDAMAVTDTQYIVSQADLLKEREQLTALQEGTITGFAMEKSCVMPDGGVRWIHQTLSPLWQADEEPSSYVVVIHDVTERKTAERARIQSQKLDSLSTLAAGLAHDFNNLLQAILGLSNVAGGFLSPTHEARGSLQQIEKTVDDAAKLVKQLTAYAGVRRFTPASIEFSALIRKTVGSVKPLVPPSVNVILDDPGDQVFVEGDPVQIQEAVVNLLQNAVEAIGEQGGDVQVSLSAPLLTAEDIPNWSAAGLVPTPGRYAMLKIQDSGC
ncbi:MAG: response regulator, partial [Nitrospira sp.]|nr:response regulator [Nitrospira sp.]